jgi:N-acetylglucosamine-6-phosphate deacetylase
MNLEPTLVITDARLVTGCGVIEGACIVVEQGRIAHLGSAAGADAAALQTAKRVSAGGRLVSTGLVDIHTHGIGSHLFEGSPEELSSGALRMAQVGTTSFLPTLYTCLTPGHLGHIERLADAARAFNERGGAARIAGFHLEGPFLALTGAAALCRETDLVLARELVAACGGMARVMSVSPELPGICGIIEDLTGSGVRVFLTHTAATAEDTARAIDAGARHATHFYDVFPAPAEKEPGVRQVGAQEAILATARCTVDFIADGVHVDPLAIRLASLCKGWEKVALISDSNIGTALPPGRYETPWGFPVRVSPDDAARIDDPAHPEYGGLAGSSLVLARAVRNVREWFNLPFETAVAMASSTPSEVAGLGSVGRMEVGAHADLVVWSDELAPVMVVVGGEVMGDPGAGQRVRSVG